VLGPPVADQHESSVGWNLYFTNDCTPIHYFSMDTTHLSTNSQYTH